MPTFSSTRRVQHSASDMFALVADVDAYPQFVPLCEGLDVRSRRERDGRTIVMADMTVGYKAIRETFTSQVVLRPDVCEIDASNVDGPFKHMNNTWRFAPAGGDACDVHFHIDYAFKNRMLGMLMGAMFDKAFRRFSEAFERRADQVYGRRGQAIARS